MKNEEMLFGINARLTPLDKDGIQNASLPPISKCFKGTEKSPVGKKVIPSPGPDKF